MFSNYLDKIFKTSESYLKKQLDSKELELFKKLFVNKKLKETGTVKIGGLTQMNLS